jgi:hypothetical protein
LKTIETAGSGESALCRKKADVKIKLLVLVPHRDTRVMLRKWSASLCTLFDGVLFPQVIPLALITRYFNEGELKHCAASLGKTAPAPLASAGKFTTAASRETQIDDHALIKSILMSVPSILPDSSARFSVYGPALNINLPPAFFCETAKVKVKDSFNDFLIGCLLRPACENSVSENFPPLQRFSFGAAAIANMSLRAIGQDACYMTEWKIGKLCWLPKVK